MKMIDLSVFRKNGQIDLNDAISNGKVKIDEIEKKGAREKFWCNNYTFLYKKIFDGSYEDFAEIITYELANIFGLECAEYDLATYNGERGIISYNYIKDMERDFDISGTEIINIVFEQHIKPLQNIYNSYIDLITESKLDKSFDNYNNLSRNIKNILLNKLFLLYRESNIKSFYIGTLEIVNIEKLTDEELKNYFYKFKMIFDEMEILYDYNENQCYNGIIKANNLFDLWYIIEKFCDLKGYKIDEENLPILTLTNYFIFDIITSQGDRHADNWGIVVNSITNVVKIAPLYDNSNICNLNRSKAIKSIKEYIDLYNSASLNDVKKSRIKERISMSINHSIVGLKLDPEYVGNREKNIKQIQHFIAITDTEQMEEFILKIKKLEGQLENVFLKIENKIGIKIPEIIKIVVSYTIKSNIEIFLRCYEENKIRRKI